jgi:hypothetical protein
MITNDNIKKEDDQFDLEDFSKWYADNNDQSVTDNDILRES